MMIMMRLKQRIKDGWRSLLVDRNRATTMIALLLIMVVTSTGLANRQSSDGLTADVRKSGVTPHGPSHERSNMPYQGHIHVDITCAHTSDAVCRFIVSVYWLGPSSVMDTCGGPDCFRKLSMYLVFIISFAMIVIRYFERTHPRVQTVILTFGMTSPFGQTIPIIIAIYRRYNKWWRQPIRVKCTRNLIETGEYPYIYPVFVSASSYHELRPFSMTLERKLQIACRTDRQLVCSRDNFTPGASMFSETTNFLGQSGMMITVVSSQYNECEWCEEEFKQARMLRKPILIIKSEDVDETEMNLLLREVIRQNVPITIDDEYNITPDWQSVCDVILQLLPC